MTTTGPTQGVRDDEVVDEASGAKPDRPERKTGIAGLIQRVVESRPVRTFLHYNEDNGPLLASGLSYQAFFALFAALFFTFSVLGFVIKGTPGLLDALLTGLQQTIPGLVGESGQGAITREQVDQLLDSGALGLSSAVSIVTLLLTTVGFLGTLRTGIRAVFDLPQPVANPVLLKLKDTGLTLAFGLAVLVPTAISLVTNAALGLVLDLLRLDRENTLANLLTTFVGIVVIAALFTVLLAAAFRILSGIPVPRKRLWAGALIGGVGLALLQALGSSLLGGVRNNPLIASFAVILGLLIYFNFVCQVILLAASWIAVGMKDAGIDARALSPEQREVEEAAELERARRLVAKANKEALEERIRQSSGLARWRLVRELKREIRAELKRRRVVPTQSEFKKAQEETGDASPTTSQVQDVLEDGARR